MVVFQLALEYLPAEKPLEEFLEAGWDIAKKIIIRGSSIIPTDENSIEEMGKDYGTA